MTEEEEDSEEEEEKELPVQRTKLLTRKPRDKRKIWYGSNKTRRGG